MRDYIGAMIDLLGPTATLVPLGLPATNWNGQAIGENQARTTVTAARGASGLSAVFTYSEARDDFDTPTLYLGRGHVPAVRFNGTDEEADTPDDTYWSRGDGVNDAVMTVGCFIRFDAKTNPTIFSKTNTSDGLNREYDYNLGSGRQPFLQLFDQSAGVACDRTAATALPTGIWVHIAATYSGVGGAAATAGINLYRNGVLDNGTRTDNAGYVAMENGAELPMIGARRNAGVPTRFLGATLAGGFFYFAQAEESAEAIRALNAVGWEALRSLGIDQYHPMRR